jgi:group II intron reverse transcriptase/maturase
LSGRTSLQGIATKAGVNKSHRFESLFGLLNTGFLRECWNGPNRKAASGVDRVTAAEFEKDLETNIEELVECPKSGRYHAKLVRRCYIPKGNGKTRPSGIPAVGDRLLQPAVARILEAIYEQDFPSCGFGCRPKAGTLDAVAEITRELQFGRHNYIVDTDIKGFFDGIDHDWLVKMLEQRVNGRPFLNLIRKWLKAGVLEPDGDIVHPVAGTPRGGIVSPVLANVYLHDALDLWFGKKVKPACGGAAYVCRHSDDFVRAFQHKWEAEAFCGELAGGMDKFGLSLSAEKTAILRFSRLHPGLGSRFSFPGFEFYWKRDRRGIPRVGRRTDGKGMRRSIGNCGEWLRKNRNLGMGKLFSGLNSKLRGYYNCYGVIGNDASLGMFCHETCKLPYKWLNRRSQRRSFDRKGFRSVLERFGIGRPRITRKRGGRFRQLELAI